MGHYRIVKRGSYMDSLEGSVTGIKEDDKEDEFYDSDDISDNSDAKVAQINSATKKEVSS